MHTTGIILSASKQILYSLVTESGRDFCICLFVLRLLGGVVEAVRKESLTIWNSQIYPEKFYSDFQSNDL